MKTKNVLAVLALGCLFSCQQSEELTAPQSLDAINFVMKSDGLALNNATRSMNFETAGKSAFNKGDVLSLGTADDFHAYVVGRNAYSWGDFSNKGTKFYAHYPELASYQLTDKRQVVGGAEYLFGATQEAVPSGEKSVELSFNRMSVPVILLDSKNRPYTGDAKVILHVRNHGVQDLTDGTVAADPANQKVEGVEVKKMSEGVATNIIPQVIEEGATFLTLVVNGQSYDVTMPETSVLESGVTKGITITLPKSITEAGASTRAAVPNKYRIIIASHAKENFMPYVLDDGCIPLRK